MHSGLKIWYVIELRMIEFRSHHYIVNYTVSSV